jgi:UDP-N-acetylmuramate: L-alanyl-gamma-D-glutamyl-meso-diaminopimelate ligase
VQKLLSKLGLLETCTKTGSDKTCFIQLKKQRPNENDGGYWTHTFESPWGELDLECILGGEHGGSNVAQVLGALFRLQELSGSSWDKDKILSVFKSFRGVARRLDLLAEQKNIKVIEDFAHHPTAIDKVLRAYKQANPKRRLWVAFEARSATSRRNIFTDAFAESLGHADKVLVGPAFEDKRLAESERMNTSILAKKIGSHARSCNDNNTLKETLQNEMQAGDTVIFMSCGSFGGIQHEIAKFVEGL